MNRLLETKAITKKFGGLAAVSDLNIWLDFGELIGMIGPNGAGKTTVFNLLTGVYEPTEGDISFADQRINGLKTFQIARIGAARTFQNIRLFKNLTTLENVKVAGHMNTHSGLYASLFKTHSQLTSDSEIDGRARKMLEAMNLSHAADIRAGDLAYGLQRRLEIARALATSPKLLLLDEPAAGMNPQEKQELMGLIRKIREDFSLTILLIEHDMKLVMGICERIYVLDYGKIIAQGNPSEISRNPKVIAAYLGEDYSDDTALETP